MQHNLFNNIPPLLGQRHACKHALADSGIILKLLFNSIENQLTEMEQVVAKQTNKQTSQNHKLSIKINSSSTQNNRIFNRTFNRKIKANAFSAKQHFQKFILHKVW